MSKKPKIDKRLDKLFKGLTPEESASKPKNQPTVEKKRRLHLLTFQKPQGNTRHTPPKRLTWQPDCSSGIHPR